MYLRMLDLVWIITLAAITSPSCEQAMRREIAEQFAQRPWYTSGSTLVVSRLTAPRVVLLGDAAHAVSAAFGQGVNSALEVRAAPTTMSLPVELHHRALLSPPVLLPVGEFQRQVVGGVPGLRSARQHCGGVARQPGCCPGEV
jgi:hypothetical protein